ncbi:transcriptional regulator [Xenorhabdus indica]|nr:transcriptional regulator [Xenorhabdus indica]
MKFEDLPDAAKIAAIEVYKTIAIRELVLVDNQCKEKQTAKLENLAESLAKGFSKLIES